EWAIRMSENGFAYSTINNYKRSLKASFYIAIQDDYVRKNPFDFQLNTVIDDDTVPKIALTKEQGEKLLAFTKADKTYSKNHDEILILLKTGLRISEFGGLTLSDLDFKNRLIHVDHQLLRDTEIGYYIEIPKTKNGERQVPMVEEAYQAFQRVLAKRKNGKHVEIDGYSDFLFLNRRSEEHTSELHVSISYAVFCLIQRKQASDNHNPFPTRRSSDLHQLLRDTEIGYYIEIPKTKNGERQVPMVEEAYQAFQRVLAKRKNGKHVEIDGYSDFLFLNR